MLRVLLDSKNVSLYQLEKTSHICHATLNDIYNERSNIENCSISVISKIADSLSLSIDATYKLLTYHDLSLITYDEDFDLFKSNTLQQLKNNNEDTFINEIVNSNVIDDYFNNQQQLKALYLLSLIDYLTLKKHAPLLKQFEYLRNYKLDKLYVSKSTYLLLAMKMTTITSIYKECIKEFLKRNIAEADINDVI